MTAVSFGAGKVRPGVFHVKHGQTGRVFTGPGAGQGRVWTGLLIGPTGYHKPE